MFLTSVFILIFTICNMGNSIFLNCFLIHILKWKLGVNLKFPFIFVTSVSRGWYATIKFSAIFLVPNLIQFLDI